MPCIGISRKSFLPSDPASVGRQPDVAEFKEPGTQQAVSFLRAKRVTLLTGPMRLARKSRLRRTAYCVRGSLNLAQPLKDWPGLFVYTRRRRQLCPGFLKLAPA
jgi:hypothetical protein